MQDTPTSSNIQSPTEARSFRPRVEQPQPVSAGVSTTSRSRPTRTVRPLNHVSPDFDCPLDITLNPSLATAMNWTSYYTLNKTDQALMLDRVFHDDIRAQNARRLMSRITRHQALLELVNGPPGIQRAEQIQQNDQAITTLRILIRTVDNHSTSQDRTLSIIADIAEAITVLIENRSTLINRATL